MWRASGEITSYPYGGQRCKQQVSNQAANRREMICGTNTKCQLQTIQTSQQKYEDQNIMFPESTLGSEIIWIESFCLKKF